MLNILYLGYWNLDDPLTQSTIFPNLKVLKEIDNIDAVHFLNTQREKPSFSSKKLLSELGVFYKPLFSKNIKPNLLNKIYDFYFFPNQIIKHCQKHKINFIIGRGAPAGVLAFKASKVLKIPFIVESFEPHADYMKYSGTWKSYDPRYLFQKKWENQVKANALQLITVSHNYKNQLIAEGIKSNKIEVVPCAVDQNQFFSNTKMKLKMREELIIPQNATVGVYAGKFGNLYHDREAFKLFKEAYKNLDNFYLLLLSNEKDEFINQRLNEFKIPKERLVKKFVKHYEMPNYLNVADFAFATIKNMSVSKFQSPVKTGEYWACGLPILLSEGVGDESNFMIKEKGGLLIRNYNQDTIKEVIHDLKKLLNSYINPLHYARIAAKYRSFDKIKSTYKKILLSE